MCLYKIRRAMNYVVLDLGKIGSCMRRRLPLSKASYKNFVILKKIYFFEHHPRRKN